LWRDRVRRALRGYTKDHVMINPRRIAQFLVRVLIVVIPFLAIVFALSILTELLTSEEELAELVREGNFWLAVALDTIPALVVMALVFWLPGRFVNAVYQLGGLRDGIKFLLFSRFGRPGFGPWAKIEQGEIAEGGPEIITHLGGPGNLIIYRDSAVVLERGGRLTQVVGSMEDGERHFPEVRAFEKIYDIVDLRPKRWVHSVQAMSKDGIRINWDAEVRYQIGDGGRRSTAREPYPLSEENVFRAATSKWVLAPGKAETMDWEGQLVIAAAERNLRMLLAQHRLDELIGLTEIEEQAVRETLQEELAQRLRDEVPRWGAQILQVTLGNLAVDDTITQQWIKNWRAYWQNWSAHHLAPGEASHVYQYEKAKAEAQMELIAGITRGLQDQLANQTITTQAIPRIILMRLFSALDRGAFSRTSRVFFPSQALDALGKLEALRQPAQGDGQHTEPPVSDDETP